MDKSVVAPPPPPQWVLELNGASVAKPRSTGIADPPGYSGQGISKRGTSSSKQPSPPMRKGPNVEEMAILKMKKAWELAIAPAKSLPMSAIGMYMTGNTLQVFSIFMVYSLFKTPLQALLSINSTFARYDNAESGAQMLGVKAVFVLCNLLALGLGIYKIDKMGLLPTTRSDWLAWEAQRLPLERAYPKFAY